jgi:hypothetical protein
MIQSSLCHPATLSSTRLQVFEMGASIQYIALTKQIAINPINQPNTVFYCLFMKKPSPQKSRTFKYISEAAIRRDFIDLSPWQSIELRAKLPKKIYWIQPSERGKIHWNWTLLQSYLLNGDCQSHRDLVDEYMSTLPTAA